MSVAVVTPTVTSHYMAGRRQIVNGRLSIAAGDYATNGLTVNLSTLFEIKSSRPPETVVVHGIAGFIYEFNIGTTKANGKLLIRGTGSAQYAALSQVAASALDAGITGDTIAFTATFRAFN
jgi:hypothetical protein